MDILKIYKDLQGSSNGYTKVYKGSTKIYKDPTKIHMDPTGSN